MGINSEDFGFRLSLAEVRAIARRFDRTQKIVFVLLFATFVLSVVLSVVNFPKYREVLVYFPDLRGQVSLPEKQFVPWGHSTEEGVRLLVDEVLLGPIDLLKLPIFPEATRLSSVFLTSDNRLILNFSQEILAGGPSHATVEGYEKAFQLLERTIRANFPFFGSIEFLVSGQVYGVPPFWL